MNKTEDIFVSIFCLAYNHHKFINQAIEGMLMQKTNFKYEIVIGEDCSTDGTREIVFDYQIKYPEVIKVITSKRNVGIRKNADRTKKACIGKYIAFCEGDDYWLDPLKLHKQVTFMEENPDYSLCFHNAIILRDDKSSYPKYFCANTQKQISSTEDVIEKYFIATASMVFQRKYINDLPGWTEEIYNGDWAIQLILSTHGKVYYFDEIMSVYRKSKQGLSGSANNNVKFISNRKIELLNYFNEYSKFKFSNQINHRIKVLEKNISEYNLKEKNKFLFWLLHPKRYLNMRISKCL